jgi:hypothetical protein
MVQLALTSNRQSFIASSPEGAESDSAMSIVRRMEEPRYEGRLYGEISAMTQVNRLPEPLVVLLFTRSDLGPAFTPTASGPPGH